MNLSKLVEQQARKALRRGFHRNSSTWITFGALCFVIARLTRHEPQVVYQEELPVGTTLTISFQEPGGGRVPPAEPPSPGNPDVDQSD
jgi:hypothetical protein